MQTRSSMILGENLGFSVFLSHRQTMTVMQTSQAQEAVMRLQEVWMRSAKQDQ